MRRGGAATFGPMPFRPLRPSLALALALSLLLPGCIPADGTASQSGDLSVDLSDPSLRRVVELQDQMLVDSLVGYFGSAQPEQRYLAARAFGSLRDEAAVAPLTELLADPVLEVRTVAAYALGQQGESGPTAAALTAAFEPYDTAGYYAPFHRAVLEAVGKAGDTAALRALATVSTYRPRDTLLQLGRLQGLYRLALRGITSEAGTEQALVAATRSSDTARGPTLRRALRRPRRGRPRGLRRRTLAGAGARSLGGHRRHLHRRPRRGLGASPRGDRRHGRRAVYPTSPGWRA